MPQPAHNRITFSGIFGFAESPVEFWSWGLKTGPQDFASAAARQTYVEAVRALYESHVASLVATNVRLTQTRVSEHAVGGLTKTGAEGAYAQADDFTNVPGGSSAGAVLPLQTACVISLRTARPGPTGRGRVFLPATNLAPSAGAWTWPNSLIQGHADGFRNLILGINNLSATPGISGRVHVVSSKGYMSLVDEVAVGNVPDTMRSRRNSLQELYVVNATAF